MKPIRSIRRLAAALAGLVCAWLGLAIGAPTAFAALKVPPPGSGPPGISVLHEPPGWNKHPPLPLGHVTGPVYQIHTVVVGDMPGWRIALIAAATALIAATVAVLLDRTRTRRKSATAAARAAHSQTDIIGRIKGREHDVPRFMDFHQDLKLPAEVIAQIADDARHARADQFGVRQIESYRNDDGQVYCLLDGPDEQAIRAHHAALGVPCGDIHQVDSIS